MTRTLFMIFLGLTLSSVPAQAWEGRTKVCNGKSEAVEPCFWIQGRFGLYNGSTVARIWRIGTTRILGIPDDYSFAEPLEEAIDKAQEMEARAYRERPEVRVHWWIFGDFHVCPLEKDRVGHMRQICVDAAKNLRIVERASRSTPPR